MVLTSSLFCAHPVRTMKPNASADCAIRKRHGLKAVRTNITLHPVLWDHAHTLVSARGYNGLSDYFQACIRRDAGLESLPIA
jgi:hypothetical protein